MHVKGTESYEQNKKPETSKYSRSDFNDQILKGPHTPDAIRQSGAMFPFSKLIHPFLKVKFKIYAK